MAIANGSMSFTTEQFTSTYKVVDGSVAWNIPGEPAARFMFPHTQTLVKEVTCVMRSGVERLRNILFMINIPVIQFRYGKEK